MKFFRNKLKIILWKQNLHLTYHQNKSKSTGFPKINFNFETQILHLPSKRMIFFCIKFEIVSWIENLYTLHTYSRPKALTYIPRNEGVPPQDAPNANKFNSFGAKHGSELTISSIQHKLAANIFIFILLYVFFSHHTTNSLYQNLHWKLGQKTPSVGTLLAYLETMA